MSSPDAQARPGPAARRWLRWWARSYRGWVPWALVLAHMAVIFALSAIPGGRVSAWNVWKLPDFAAHLFLYAVLGLLLFGAFRQQGTPVGRAAVYSVAVAVLYGISDEVHQRYVPGRTPDGWDVVWDGAGALASVAWAAACAARRAASKRCRRGGRA